VVPACCDNGRVRDLPIEQGTGLAGFRRYTWWSLTATTEFFLVFIGGYWILNSGVPLWARTVGAVALVVAGAASAVLFARRMPLVPAGTTRDARSADLPLAWLIAGGAGAAVLGGTMLAVRDDQLWSLPPALMTSVIATFLSPPRRWVLITAAATVAAVLGLVTGLTSGDGMLRAVVLPPGMVAISAFTALSMLWGWDVAERLEGARRMAAELAVADERLRFAADLHDIQGHHLQVIALKSELAARLAELDPGRAAAEMKEVQRLATDALTDTRAVVQGYRRTTLDEEIANATRVLAAADIDARMTVESAGHGDRLPDSSRHLLGLVMRESTTNVLRHSQARHAEVEYRITGGVAHLRVSNDGVADPPRPGAGTGLRSLAERLKAAGGDLTWKHENDRFVVAARLPADAPANLSEAP
jgi:two-component system sensor histidine kinase DesK